MKKSTFIIFFFFVYTSCFCQSYKLFKTLNYEKGIITYLTFDINNNILSGDINGNIFITTLNGQILKELKGHRGEITDVIISSDYSFIGSASYDGTIRIWNDKYELVHIFTNSSIQNYRNVEGNEPTFLIFSPDNKFIYYGGYNRQISKANISNYRTKRIFYDDKYGITSARILSDCLIFGLGGKIKFLNLQKKKIVYEIGYHSNNYENYVCEIAINHSDSNQWAYWSVGGNIHIYNNRISKKLLKASKNNGSATIAFSNDGKYLFSANYFGIKIWDIKNDDNIEIIKSKNIINVFALSKNDNYIAYGDKEKISIWKKIAK